MTFSHHHELHVALSAVQAEQLIASGMTPLGDTEICSNCGTDIAHTHTKFIPFAFVLNEHESHNLCLTCAAPVVRPRS